MEGQLQNSKKKEEMCAKPLFRVDLHTHILPKDLPDLSSKYGYGGFVHLEHHQPSRARMLIDGKFFREIEDNCYSAEKRIAECDRDYVDVQGNLYS